MNFGAVISLLGGLAFFLFGMRTMGEGLERAAGPKLKHLLSLMTRSRLTALLTGLTATALIQSSGATTVMVIGFVNARLMTLQQAVGVILGANVGTTVTSLLLSIRFDPGPLFAFAGFLMIAFLGRKESVRQTGYVFMGLGILFHGMRLMSDSMEPLRSWPVFLRLMQRVRHPLPGILVGALVTALLQSSSVSVGIIQMLAASGLVGMDGALYLVLGAKLGACTPALLATADATVSGKRTALIHLLFNCIGAALVALAASFLPLTSFFESLSPGNPKLCIAWMHVLSSAVCAAVLLPASGLMIRLSALLIPGGDAVRPADRLEYYDPSLLATPALAADMLCREVCRLGESTRAYIDGVLRALKTGDFSDSKALDGSGGQHAELAKAIGEGLAALMASEQTDDRLINQAAALYRAAVQIRRIGDQASTLYRQARKLTARVGDPPEKTIAELSSLAGRAAQALDALRGSPDAAVPHPA